MTGWRARLAVARRLFRELTGDAAYERYLEHHAEHHPDRAPMTEREFWRERTDRQDRVPTARCC
ncbi:YbdD/YjiX family protein [Pseudonocardia phyllosphaerae]|uniref:YbdD/YjiX family protein n=1 Tax=Pseudonocardia phyllosphaerae TaxID=3390502 RepID=UPI00397AC9FA